MSEYSDFWDAQAQIGVFIEEVYGGPVCQDSPGPFSKKFLPSFRGLAGLRFRSPQLTLFRA